ncbi:hypothetical protein BD413DRAFT_592517 [Trametes elegans]|nr:hypothetical protein BD413DRAFT_592517 [Trametes elegans]
MLDRFTQLCSFSHHVHLGFPCNRYREFAFNGLLNPLWFTAHDGPLKRHICSKVRFLDLVIPFTPEVILDIHRLLYHAPALSSLKLICTIHHTLSALIPSNPRDLHLTETLNATALVLPALEQLELEGGCEGFPDYVYAQWSLPRLTHLTLLRCMVYPERFLARFGANLTYLDLYGAIYRSGGFHPSLFEDTFTQSCPAPVPLVLPESLSLPTLKRSGRHIPYACPPSSTSTSGPTTSSSKCYAHLAPRRDRRKRCSGGRTRPPYLRYVVSGFP